MERKNDKTIFLLIAAGLGIYWFMKNKATQPATTAVISPSMPETAPVVPYKFDPSEFGYNPNNQIEVNLPKSTQPVYEQPIYQAPIMADVISTQPVYEQPIYQALITEDVVNTQYVYDQYVYEQPNYTAPVSEMLDSLVYFGGNKAEDKYK